MTIEEYNRSGAYKYVAYDNDGKVLIITSSKIALKTACYSIKSPWCGQSQNFTLPDATLIWQSLQYRKIGCPFS